MLKRKTQSAENTVKEWMRAILKDGLTANQWGVKANVSPSTITRFLKGDGESVPSFKTLYNLARAANVSLPGVSVGDHPPGTEINIPVYRTPVSAGPGTELVDQSNEPEYFFQASANWLKEWTPTHPNHLGFIRVSGSSMEPNIYDGELVLVDFSCRRFDGDGIYVLRSVGDVLQLKRVIYQYDSGGYEVRNDNAKYPAFKVGPEGIEIWAKALIIVGRKLD